MNRYLQSFSITLVLYILLSVTFLYSFDLKQTLKTNQTKSDQAVKFTIIQEKIVKKTSPQKKLNKKIVEKQKKIIVKEKQIIKKNNSIKKKSIQKKVSKTQVKEKQKPQLAKKQFKKNNSNILKQTNNLDTINKRKIQQEKYYTQIKELINNNKYYPKIAIRRRIEGSVKVQFTLSEKGDLLSFKIIEGKRVFKKSVTEAVKKSFPFLPPKGVLISNTQLSLTINYRLY